MDKARHQKESNMDAVIEESFDLPDEGRALELVFNSYAKDPEKTVRFRDDRERKQKLATVLVRSAANRWAMESYSELRRWKRPEGSS